MCLKDSADKKNHLISESKSAGFALIALDVVFLMSREMYIRWKTYGTIEKQKYTYIFFFRS